MTLRVLLVALGVWAAGACAYEPVAAADEPKWRGLVVVLVPPTQDDVTRNALARIMGELAAAPFRTITHTVDPLSDVMTQVERAGIERDATAAFAIVRQGAGEGSGGADGGRVTIWVSNRLMGTTSIHRMHVEDGDVDRAATRLAVEAVELVRASLAGVWPSAGASTAATTPASVAPAAADALVASGGGGMRAPFSLAVAVGVLQDLAGGPRFWAPNVALTYGTPGRLSFRASLVALGPGATVFESQASAQLQRTWLSVGVGRSFRANSALQPYVGLGVGAHYVSASGAARASQMTYDRSAFSGAATATVGVAFRLGSRIALTLAADILMIWPTVTIRIAELDAATLRGPALFPHGGLRASF